MSLNERKERALLFAGGFHSSIHSNCIRSHAFYRRSKTCWVLGRADSHQNSNRKQQQPGEIIITFEKLIARKVRDLKAGIWVLLLTTSGSFYSVLTLNRSIYTVLSRLKAVDKCYLNYFTSA